MAKIQLQMLFSAAEEKQQNIRGLKAMIKDAYNNSPAFKEASEAVEKAKEKLKAVKIAIESDFTSDLDAIDRIKTDLEVDTDNLSAIALERFRQGEELVVVNKNGVAYEAEFKVKFKKSEKQPASL